MNQFWFTGLFMAPWTGMMVFFGTTISNVADAVAGNYEAGPYGLAAMIGGSVVAIVAFIFLSIIKGFSTRFTSKGKLLAGVTYF